MGKKLVDYGDDLAGHNLVHATSLLVTELVTNA
jgi:hypothetical protein